MPKDVEVVQDIHWFNIELQLYKIRKILLQFILFCKHMFGIMYLGLGAMIRHKNNRPGLVNFGSCGGIKNG